jgi:exosortase D (VPLPA-CTERM-specific)
MNSFRIGLIGITVEYGGKSMAEGFLHDFEGWVIFMACTSVIVGEMWLLSRWATPRRHFREVFGLEFPASAPAGMLRNDRRLPRSYIAAIVLIAIASVIATVIPQREHLHPVRKNFSEFPLHIGQWKGYSLPLEKVYLDELKLDDYILANFLDTGHQPANLYVSYYATQADGNSAHSPRACLPGDGWEIGELATRDLPGVRFKGEPLRVNRAVIQKGEDRQLVYYWFQQRGRNVTGEYTVKLYLFRDALMRNRSDGAMVRLVAPLGGEIDPAPGSSLRCVGGGGEAWGGEERFGHFDPQKVSGSSHRGKSFAEVRSARK